MSIYKSVTELSDIFENGSISSLKLFQFLKIEQKNQHNQC